VDYCSALRNFHVVSRAISPKGQAWLLKNSISKEWSEELCARMPYKRRSQFSGYFLSPDFGLFHPKPEFFNTHRCVHTQISNAFDWFNIRSFVSGSPRGGFLMVGNRSAGCMGPSARGKRAPQDDNVIDRNSPGVEEFRGQESLRARTGQELQVRLVFALIAQR
jgi:hypothetical protein